MKLFIQVKSLIRGQQLTNTGAISLFKKGQLNKSITYPNDSDITHMYNIFTCYSQIGKTEWIAPANFSHATLMDLLCNKKEKHTTKLQQKTKDINNNINTNCFEKLDTNCLKQYPTTTLYCCQQGLYAVWSLQLSQQ